MIDRERNMGRSRLTAVRCGAALAAVLGALCVGWAGPGLAAGADQLPDLSRLSLEELAQVEITSVSRRPEAVSTAAASIFVISAEDIRRSGAASLPEVLRLAPNLQVQRMDAGDYAITARGFNGFETANKLLVLIDGRSVYSSLHSGVFWDAQGVMLEDIARIEVISGPGGTLWGANAMNGVINIITRPAGETSGGLVSAGAGNEDRTLAMRYGGDLGEAGAYRIYATAFDRDDSFLIGGGDADDATSGVQAGFRMDWSAGPDGFTLQGDAYEHQVFNDHEVTGANLLGRWTRDLGVRGSVQVQGYYDHATRVGPQFDEVSDTFDLLFQHAFDMDQRHRIVWGGGVRRVEDRLISGTGSFLSPEAREITLSHLFAQDQIALTPDLALTLGVKLEDSSFSGLELLPNVRLAWTRDDGSLVWGAISRAVRTPNRIERDLTLPGFLVGGDFQSETLVAYELGYRARLSPALSMSVSAFYNDYSDLRTADLAPVTLFPISFANSGAGHAYGIEAWGVYDVNARWRLTAGLSAIEKDFSVRPGVVDISGLASTGDDPEYQVFLGSRADLTDALELDVRVRAVDDLPRSGLDGYVEAEARLGWRVNDSLEVALVGSNLLDERHVESPEPGRARAFGRSVYATLRVGF